MLSNGISAASGLQCSQDSISFSVSRDSRQVDEDDVLLFRRGIEEVAGHGRALHHYMLVIDSDGRASRTSTINAAEDSEKRISRSNFYGSLGNDSPTDATGTRASRTSAPVATVQHGLYLLGIEGLRRQ